MCRCEVACARRRPPMWEIRLTVKPALFLTDNIKMNPYMMQQPTMMQQPMMLQQPMMPPFAMSGPSCPTQTTWPLVLIVFLAIFATIFTFWYAGLVPDSIAKILGNWARGPRKGSATTPPTK